MGKIPPWPSKTANRPISSSLANGYIERWASYIVARHPLMLDVAKLKLLCLSKWENFWLSAFYITFPINNYYYIYTTVSSIKLFKLQILMISYFQNYLLHCKKCCNHFFLVFLPLVGVGGDGFSTSKYY